MNFNNRMIFALIVFSIGLLVVYKFWSKEVLAMESREIYQELDSCNDSWIADNCMKYEVLSYKVCRHPVTNERLISADMKTYGVFDRDISKALVRFARSTNSTKTTFLDIGASIGPYALFMAANKVKTIAVEPAPPNFKLLARSVAINNFYDRLTIIPYGISNKRSTRMIKMSTDFSGQTYYYIPGELTKTDAVTESEFEIRTLLLSDLLPFLPQDTSSPVVLKIDMERHECSVFKDYERFIQRVNVTHIVMEWFIDHQPCRKEMADLFIGLRYVPKTMDGKKIDNIPGKITEHFDLYWERVF